MPFMFLPEHREYPLGTGTCLTCNTPRRQQGYRRQGGERVIDLGVNTDEILDLDGQTFAYRAPTICETCVRELATMIGCSPPDKVAELGAKLIAAEDARNEAKRKLERVLSGLVNQ